MIWLGWIAGFISLAGFIPYILSIIKKETRPHLLTWMIWTLVGSILAGSYYYSANPSLVELLVPIAYVIGPLIITCLAFYYGEIKYSSFDIFCLSAALFSLVLGVLLKNPFLVLIFNILLDFFGALPTIHKTYLDPASENLFAWSLFLLGNFLNLIALPSWDWVLVLYPFYLFSVALILTLLIVRGHIKIKIN
jgi:hypothetical protein